MIKGNCSVFHAFQFTKTNASFSKPVAGRCDQHPGTIKLDQVRQASVWLLTVTARKVE